MNYAFAISGSRKSVAISLTALLSATLLNEPIAAQPMDSSHRLPHSENGTAEVSKRVERLLEKHKIIDGHNDLPWEIRRLHQSRLDNLDLSGKTPRDVEALQTDLARLKKGKVGGQFWSTWIPVTETGASAVRMTIEQIDLVKRMIDKYPEQLMLASTAEEIEKSFRTGKTASLIGVEGGHQIDGRLAMLRQYRDLGVSYVTLTHSANLSWAGSATDTPLEFGLSPFGKAVVMEMNRLGLMVDLSHVSDKTFRAALRESRAPVIASHSSSRAIVDHPRNVPDDLLREISANGGIVMATFVPAFVSQPWREWAASRAGFQASLTTLPMALAPADKRRQQKMLLEWQEKNPEPRVTVKEVADHIEHVARIAGHDHVGLGGDYDGMSGNAPDDMKGVDSYPALFEELAKRGWSDENLGKLASGNILRVMRQVKAVAETLPAPANEEYLLDDASDRPNSH